MRLVVERMTSLGWLVGITQYTTVTGAVMWFVSFALDEKFESQQAADLPCAVCVAALQVMGG